MPGCIYSFTHQCMEYVPLVEVDGDHCLKLCAVRLGELLGGHLNDRVEDLLEVVVGGLHDLAVSARPYQSLCGSSRPDDLQAKEPNLKWYRG